MSKLYKKYVLLKINKKKKIYLFECGIFYIFIDEDAKLMSKILNLKLTLLNSVIFKCGFPVNSINKYLQILKNSNYNIEIVPSDNFSSPISINNFAISKKIEKIIYDFLKHDINSLSISQAFDLLNDLQIKFRKIIGEKDNEEKK